MADHDVHGVARPEDLEVMVEDGIGWLRFNRPEVLNALTAAHFRQLEDAVYDVGWRKEVGVVVLTGAGRAFCAGGDVRGLSKEFVVEAGKRCHGALLALRRCPKPVLAMVNGDAVGGGNEIVIACDLAVAAESARLGQAGTKLGWAPVLGGTNFLPMVIGDKRAREISFLSRIVPARTALEWGWVNEVVPDGELEAATRRWCAELLDRAPEGLRLAKATANIWWDLCYASFSFGLSMLEAGVSPEAVREGTSAFLEKRPPDWTPWR
jgi:enoyl-CoA hydratase/carnithine racemase